MTGRLILKERSWYGWQMLSGYEEGFLPYFSPIFVQEITPLKTGQHRLEIEFINAMYAQGAQLFCEIVRVLDHQQEYMLVALTEHKKPRRAVISSIDFKWIQRFQPQILREHTMGQSYNCQDYLNQVYFERL